MYLAGRSDVDVSVAVATRFLDETDQTIPVLSECGRYQGPIVDDGMKVSISCLDSADDQNGLSGFAVYAQFSGDLSVASICQMDIVLYDSTQLILK